MPIALIFGGIVVMLVVLLLAGAQISAELSRSERLSNRLELVTTPRDMIAEKPPASEGKAVFNIVSSLGMLIVRSGLLSRKTLAELNATLEGAGFKGGRGLGLFIGAKTLLALIIPAVLYFGLHNIFTTSLFVFVKIFGGGVFGLLLPETIATRIRQNHLKQVEAGVADALDMLVICADAGLALEAGLARVAQELTMLNPALAMELTQTSREMAIGADMRTAMESLGTRTGLDTLKRLSTTLTQSLFYGTPLTAALRSLSAELRQEHLIKFEERAGKLPTLMTIPMILFILPCVFLIVAGPAILNAILTINAGK